MDADPLSRLLAAALERLERDRQSREESIRPDMGDEPDPFELDPQVLLYPRQREQDATPFELIVELA